MVTEGGKHLRTRVAGSGGRPLFSIITAVRNGAATVNRTIQSVAGQTCRDYEYLVLDAASTDGTVRVLEQCNDRIDYWRSEPDHGLYDAWNKGVGLARGQWIAFLGADDEFYPDALQNYAQFLSDPGNAGLHYVSSRVELIRAGGRSRTIGRPWNWREFSRYMNVAHVGSMHHRSLFESYGLFDQSYRMCADYELLLRARATLRAGFLSTVTAKMAYGGVSNARPHLALAEAARAKGSSGGRAAWRCAIEYQYALAKSLARTVVG